MKKILITLAALLAFAAPAAAQITVPNTLVAGTTITAGGLNTNFSTIANHALDRLSGGNLAGNVTADALVTIDGIDLSVALCATCSVTHKDLTLTSPATGLTVNGVNIVNLNGKIPAISATYFASTVASATDLTSGTVPDARFPATLPAASGVNLTALNATNLASGTVANVRLALQSLAQDITFTDATYDIGKSGATRPRDGFFSRNVAIGGTLAVTGTTAHTGNVGFGVAAHANYRGVVAGSGEASSTVVTDATGKNASLLLASTGGSPNEGGTLEFGFGYGTYQPYFAAVKGLGSSASNNTLGDLVIFVRRTSSDATLTRVATFGQAGGFMIGSTTSPGPGGIAFSGLFKPEQSTVLPTLTCGGIPDNNVSITGMFTTYTSSGGAGCEVTGFSGSGLFLFHNGTGQTVTLKHNSGSSTSGNRMSLPGSADVTVAGGEVYMLYKGTTSWNHP